MAALPRSLLAASALLALATAIVYGSCFEPRRTKVTRISLAEGPFATVLAGRSIALLSDLHFGPAGEHAADEAARLLVALRPDLIVLAGDLVDWEGRGQSYERALDFLSRLQAPLGVFAVLGDSDRVSSRKSCEFCHQPGTGSPTGRHRVVFLDNEKRLVSLPQGDLLIVGINTAAGSHAAHLNELLASDTPTILLSHSSSVFRDIDPSREVLTLSGDTHGGQLLLPGWFWRLTRPKPDPEHMHGIFREGRKTLVVTRGVGTSHVRFRFGMPPEVVILEFPAEKR